MTLQGLIVALMLRAEMLLVGAAPAVIVPLDTIELAPLPQHCGSRLARGSRPDSQMSAMEWPWSG